MEFKTAEAQRDELLQRARRKGLPVRTGQRRAMAEPAWLHDAVVAAQKYSEAVAVAVEKCAGDTAGRTCYICREDSTGTLVRGCACRGTAGIAHVSCLAEQAKILVAEALENNLDLKVKNERWNRWHTCSLCEQDYHGAVRCALGWACWKTYMGRPVGDEIWGLAINQLGRGLTAAAHHEDALSVIGAELATMRRFGASASNIFVAQNNLASTYHSLGRDEESIRIEQDVYSGCTRLYGEEHERTLVAASNYAMSLAILRRFEAAKSLLRKTLPVARRVLGEGNALTLKMRKIYAMALYEDVTATLDDRREAVTTLEEIERTARRVFGGAHPLAAGLVQSLEDARVALAAREGEQVEFIREVMAAMTPGDA